LTKDDLHRANQINEELKKTKENAKQELENLLKTNKTSG
jgi:F0F1-type ATP synthase membrane subunit b/b'